MNLVFKCFTGFFLHLFFNELSQLRIFFFSFASLKEIAEEKHTVCCLNAPLKADIIYTYSFLMYCKLKCLQNFTNSVGFYLSFHFSTLICMKFLPVSHFSTWWPVLFLASLLLTVSKESCTFHSKGSYCNSRDSVKCALLIVNVQVALSISQNETLRNASCAYCQDKCWSGYNIIFFKVFCNKM